MGIEDIVGRRLGSKNVGFGVDVHVNKQSSLTELLNQIQPEDLLKFGLIPEFVGRLPVVATLEELDEPSLVEILTKPKNALIKQYAKLFEFEKVKLRFTEGALVATAKEAMRRKSGARGLKSILEDVMLDVMYDIPAKNNVKEVLINEDVIIKKQYPVVLYVKKAESA